MITREIILTVSVHVAPKPVVTGATRDKIITLHDCGLSYLGFYKKFRRNFSSEIRVKELNCDLGVEGKLCSKQRKGIIKQSLKKTFISARELSLLLLKLGTTVIFHTIWNGFHIASIHTRTHRKRHLSLKKNCQKRSAFAKPYFSKPAEFWKNVIFFDENNFNIFGSRVYLCMLKVKYHSVQILLLFTVHIIVDGAFSWLPVMSRDTLSVMLREIFSSNRASRHALLYSRFFFSVGYDTPRGRFLIN